MTKAMNAERAKQMGYGLSVCFLLVHIAMLLLFRKYGVTPMARFNVFSIVFYLLSFLMLRTGYLWLYTVSVYLEVLLHMTLAVYFTGTEGGFHVTLIAMSTLVFYAEYLGENLNTRHVPGVALTAFGMLTYLGCIVCGRVHTSAYRLPQEVCFWLQIGWGVIVFVVNIFFLKVFVIITSHSERMLSDQARHDPLTGLYNRAGYEQLIADADLDAMTLLLVDVDCFKTINDSCGHEVGDRVLKKAAELFRSCFRSDDYICRIGGDEFAVLMRSPERLREDLIEEKIAKINSGLAEISDGLPAASVSVGVAYGNEADDMRQLFENADKALYHRKQAGRKGCSFFRGDRKIKYG